MKKNILIFTFVLFTFFFLNINQIKANTYTIDLGTSATEMEVDYLTYREQIEVMYQNLLNTYYELYYEDNPFYIFVLSINNFEVHMEIRFSEFNCRSVYEYDGLRFYISESDLDGLGFLRARYLINDAVYKDIEGPSDGGGIELAIFHPVALYSTNMELINTTDHTFVFKQENKEDLIIQPNDTIPTFKENSNLSPIEYEEIYLSDYAYVYLSFKNYDNRDFIYSPFYYRGSLTYEFVKNFGIDNVSVGGVDLSYSFDYKNSLFYFDDVYYFKDNYVVILTPKSQYDTYIKVDKNLFNIHYIEKDTLSPTITLPSGDVINVTRPDKLIVDGSQFLEKNGIGLDFSSLGNFITSIPKAFGNIISAVTSIFNLFFSLIFSLPFEYQSVLFLAFSIGLAVGLIKIFF